MDLKFINITRCTPDLYDKFLTFHNKKYRIRDILSILSISSAIVYMIIFNIMYQSYIIAILITIIFILYFISRKNYKKKTVKREFKSPKIENKEEIKFRFYNNCFIVKNKKKEQKIKYYKLYRVNNDQENFYLYTDKTHAMILSKSGFIKGTTEDFKKFISKKCRFKYSD